MEGLIDLHMSGEHPHIKEMRGQTHKTKTHSQMSRVVNNVPYSIECGRGPYKSVCEISFIIKNNLTNNTNSSS